MSPVCTCHLSVLVTCLYLSPVYTCHLSVLATCLYMSPVCTCHLSVLVTCLYMSPVCTCHLSVHVTCLYMSPVCTCHLSVFVTCLYMSPVCTCHLSVHVTCVYLSPVYTCHLSIVALSTGSPTIWATSSSGGVGMTGRNASLSTHCSPNPSSFRKCFSGAWGRWSNRWRQWLSLLRQPQTLAFWLQWKHLLFNESIISLFNESNFFLQILSPFYWFIC